MKRKIYIAIDLGASNCRIIAGRLEYGRLRLEIVHRFEHSAEEYNGHKRWNWARIIGGIKEGLVSASKNSSEKISSLSCDSWSQDFGLLDERGELLFNPVSYRDYRTRGMPQSFSHIISSEDLIKRVGVMAAPITTLCQLRAMAMEEPELLERASVLLHIADLVHYELSGEKATDWTFATDSQLRSLKSGTWDRELLALLGIPTHFLPRELDSPSFLGTIPSDRAPDGNLKGIPVVISAGHDTSAAAICMPVREKRGLFISCGTWSMLGFRTENPLITDSPDQHGCAVVGLPFKGWGFWSGVMGLWLIQECRRVWAAEGLPLSYEEIAEAAKSQSIGSVIDPDDARFTAPENMAEEIRSYCRDTGQAVPENPGEIARIVFVSLALCYKETLKKFENLLGYKFEEARIVSGGSRNSFLCQMAADAMGIPVIAGPAEAAAIGNILLQARVTEALSSDEESAELLRRSFASINYVPKKRFSDELCRRFENLRKRKDSAICRTS